MFEWLSRTELLLGGEALNRLAQSHVLVMGLGGVGGYAAELIARTGVGEMTIVDGDSVTLSNLNRQLLATTKTLDMPKSEVMAERLKSVNPNIKLNIVSHYITDVEMDSFIASVNPNFVVDAIDTLAPKITLIESCVNRKIDIVSSMGAGARVDITALKFADISKSEVCPLAKSVRKGLRQRGIKKGVMTVYSTEPVIKSSVIPTNEPNKRSTVGTVSYMPTVFGCYLAAYTIKKLTEEC